MSYWTGVLYRNNLSPRENATGASQPADLIEIRLAFHDTEPVGCRGVMRKLDELCWHIKGVV